MNIKHILIIGALASFTLNASTGVNLFIDCMRSCNDVYLVDMIEKEQTTLEEEKLYRYMLDKMLEEKLSSTKKSCSEPEFNLMGDALCYFATHGICAFEHDPKPIYLPPFSAGVDRASSDLLEFIGERTLSEECRNSFR